MKVRGLFEAARHAVVQKFATRGERDLPLQTAALPWQSYLDGEIEFLLITSRNSGRWIIPKGKLMTGKSPAEAAAIEAFEEAGVQGKVNDRAIGCFEQLKTHWSTGTMRCRVLVHALAVERVLAEWPEQAERRRRWFPVAEAASLVQSEQLASLIRTFREDRRNNLAPASAPSGRHSL